MAGRQPDYRYVPFDVTIPKATVIASPQITDVSSGDVGLLEVQCLVPPGPSGAVGWQLRLAGGVILPWQNTSTWIVADGQLLTFDVGLEVDSGLQVAAYNIGTFDHTLRFRLKVQDLVTGQVSSGPQLLPLSAF